MNKKMKNEFLQLFGEDEMYKLFSNNLYEMLCEQDEISNVEMKINKPLLFLYVEIKTGTYELYDEDDELIILDKIINFKHEGIRNDTVINGTYITFEYKNHKFKIIMNKDYKSYNLLNINCDYLEKFNVYIDKYHFISPISTLKPINYRIFNGLITNKNSKLLFNKLDNFIKYFNDLNTSKNRYKKYRKYLNHIQYEY